MTSILMPRGTAAWLVFNTSLTFKQIGDFCGLHLLEVQSIADGDASVSLAPEDPIVNGQLNWIEIRRCQNDAQASLSKSPLMAVSSKTQKKTRLYVPLSKRQSKPDAILWMIKHHPELSDAQIGRLVGSSVPTVLAVRNKDYWNYANLKPKDPVILGLCLQSALDKEVELVKGR